MSFILINNMEYDALELDTHNALYDVYSILLGLRFLGFSVTETS